MKKSRNCVLAMLKLQVSWFINTMLTISPEISYLFPLFAVPASVS